MPLCDDCGDEIHEEQILDDAGVERLYRAVADGADRKDVLIMIYDLFRESCELSPPDTMMRVADLCRGARAQ
jgi:hypothetical protein